MRMFRTWLWGCPRVRPFVSDAVLIGSSYHRWAELFDVVLIGYLAAAVRPRFVGKDPVRGVTGYSRRE